MNPGERAPDFELPATGPAGSLANGKVKLADFRDKKTVVLYFYPKDETPGCTIEACSFRDDYEDFAAAGAEVIGVSDDSVASHEKFATHHKLPFVLATDEGGVLREKFGVKKTLGLLPGRVTFVFDKNGVCKSRFDSQLRVGKHVDDALALVKKLAA